MVQNLKNDPTKSNNLVEEQSEIAENLRVELVEWKKNNNVTLPLNAAMDF